MEKKLLNFIQSNSRDGGFLQSNHWRTFQEAVGRKTFQLEEKDEDYDVIIYCHIVSHTLAIVGDYFYVPRGPVFLNYESGTRNYEKKMESFFENLIILGKKNNAGWIRIEPSSEKGLNIIKESLPKGVKIKKSASDVQPKEILVLDITKSEAELLSGMKQKTRYNLRLAEKRKVKVSSIEYNSSNAKHFDEFIRLVKITSERDRIKSHPEKYYRTMFEIIPGDILKLYAAEYKGKIIAANLVLFFGTTATYMHGASDNDFRNVMAPHLLQWRQILDAKRAGCGKYDFGGVKTEDAGGKSWEGITKFKTGFAPETDPIKFPGDYDIVLNPLKYNLYRLIQKVKRAIR